MPLKLLSAGAAQGLVGALAAQFEHEGGPAIDGTFGAVGLMKEKLEAGAPCDVIILSEKLIDALAATGYLVVDSVASLGSVRTGVAVRAGDPVPAIGNERDLRDALAAADALYFPDPQRATAGIHFAGVLERLGIAGKTAQRLRTFPNGATAMRELSQSAARQPIGCTQISEIQHTPGVTLVGPLPAGFELSTAYAAAVCARAPSPAAAQALVAMLAGPQSLDARRRAGFEP
jgi:molybdate transport system substrate-binding protein